MLYHTQAHYGEAETLYKRSLAIQEKAFGPDHPDVGQSLTNLAALYRAQGRHDLTVKYSRRVSAINRRRAVRAGGVRSTGGLSEQRKVRDVFLWHLRATIEIPADDAATRGALTGEGFEAGQLASATSAGAAVSRMAARFAAGDDALAGLVRQRHDAVDSW